MAGSLLRLVGLGQAYKGRPTCYMSRCLKIINRVYKFTRKICSSSLP